MSSKLIQNFQVHFKTFDFAAVMMVLQQSVMVREQSGSFRSQAAENCIFRSDNGRIARNGVSFGPYQEFRGVPSREAQIQPKRRPNK